MERDTDKIKTGLADFYNKVFAEIQDKPIKFLELGIYKGGSLLWWSDYFNNGEIIGVDRLIPEMELTRDIEMIKCEQGDYLGLIRIGKQHGDFDIILDDCSYQKHLTQLSFNALWRYLKPGGIYIIEDWTAGLVPYPHYALYSGLQDVVADIIKNADRLGVREVRAVRLPKGGSTALIYKL